MKDIPLDYLQPQTDSAGGAGPDDSAANRVGVQVFDDSDCESDVASSSSTKGGGVRTSFDRLHDQVNNMYQATEEVLLGEGHCDNSNRVIVVSEDATAGSPEDRYNYHDHNHSKSTTTLNMSNSNGSVDVTHLTGAARYHQQHPNESIRRRTSAPHDPSMLIPKRLMPGIAVLDAQPRSRLQISADAAPPPHTHGGKAKKKKSKAISTAEKRSITATLAMKAIS